MCSPTLVGSGVNGGKLSKSVCHFMGVKLTQTKMFPTVFIAIGRKTSERPTIYDLHFFYKQSFSIYMTMYVSMPVFCEVFTVNG